MNDSPGTWGSKARSRASCARYTGATALWLVAAALQLAATRFPLACVRAVQSARPRTVVVARYLQPAEEGGRGWLRRVDLAAQVDSGEEPPEPGSWPVPPRAGSSPALLLVVLCLIEGPAGANASRCLGCFPSGCRERPGQLAWRAIDRHTRGPGQRGRIWARCRPLDVGVEFPGMGIFSKRAAGARHSPLLPIDKLHSVRCPSSSVLSLGVGSNILVRKIADYSTNLTIKFNRRKQCCPA